MALIRRETYQEDGTVTVDEIEIPDEVVREQTLNERAHDALADLATIATSTGTLTGAQLSNAVRVLARATSALIRLQLRRLDAVD